MVSHSEPEIPVKCTDDQRLKDKDFLACADATTTINKTRDASFMAAWHELLRLLAFDRELIQDQVALKSTISKFCKEKQQNHALIEELNMKISHLTKEVKEIDARLAKVKQDQQAASTKVFNATKLKERIAHEIVIVDRELTHIKLEIDEYNKTLTVLKVEHTKQVKIRDEVKVTNEHALENLKKQAAERREKKLAELNKTIADLKAAIQKIRELLKHDELSELIHMVEIERENVKKVECNMHNLKTRLTSSKQTEKRLQHEIVVMETNIRVLTQKKHSLSEAVKEFEHIKMKREKLLAEIDELEEKLAKIC